MSSTRRKFLQVSATAASALTLGPLGLGAAVDARRGEARQQARDPRVRAFETTRVRARPVPLAKVRLTGGPLKNAQDGMRRAPAGAGGRLVVDCDGL